MAGGLAASLSVLMTRGCVWFDGSHLPRLDEKASGGRFVAFSRQKEVDRRTGGVDRPV
jgi:hypothetical protein